MYSVVGHSFYVMSMAMLLRGAGAAIAGATGGAVPTSQSVIVLALLFSTYTMAGGLVAAAYTDYLQGLMIIVLSVMLVPAGLNAIGGIGALHRQLDPSMMSIVAPVGAKEGDPWFILSMSILSLVGIVAQPHVMSATGSGKSEIEARVGMCYGNFIKRFLTIAWAFTGVIAVIIFPDLMHGLTGEHQKEVSETLFGRSIQHLLGDGWRGLMIACLIAGVTSAETFMVVGSAIFVGNFYRHVVKEKSQQHYLWAGRASSAGLLIAGISMALMAGSVTQILQLALDIVGLMGPAFWLGVLWRRANTAGVWASVLGGVLIWLATKAQPLGLPGYDHLLASYHVLIDPIGLKQLATPLQILITLGVEFGLLIFVSLLTRPQPKEQLDPFYARLLVPVGKEAECSREVEPDEKLPEWSTLGIEGTPLDYDLASKYGNGFLRRFDIETPRMNRMDAYGFLGAWALVGTLILLLMFLSGIGRP
jgi:Na+/proline symporter